MFRLNNLTKLTRKPKRIGRGGSRGGTSGRGTKGQKARTGDNQMRRGFEGGQMPLIRRLPQRGFSNKPFALVIHAISLAAIDNKFDDGATIDLQALITSGIIKNNVERIKVLGGHTIKKKLVVHAHAFSQSAHDAIVNAGGQAHKIVEG